MPIPDLNNHGLLPQGIHDCTLDEIKAQFCWNPHRTMLFENMVKFLHLETWISQLNCTVLVDGSFVRSKVDPDDIDLIIDLTNAHQDATKKMVELRTQRHHLIRQTFRLDVWPQHPLIPNSFVDFFQYIGAKAAADTNLDSRHKKGILRIRP